MVFKVRKGNIIIFAMLALLACLCVIPIIIIISSSFSTEKDIITNGYVLFPREFSLEAYRMIFKDSQQLIRSYCVASFVSIVGSVLGLLVSSMLAYVLVRKDFKPNRWLGFYVFFPLLFSAGVVPFYIYIVRFLHLKNTLTVLILPYLVTPWLVILLKGYMSTIPFSVIESAWIDGAGESSIFFKIVAPMSKPGLATVGLFYLLKYWNDWWLSLLFITDNSMIPLQLMLQRILSNVEFLKNSLFATSGMTIDLSSLPGETVRMATAVIVSAPMLFAFPFIQRYLVRGIAVGAIKG